MAARVRGRGGKAFVGDGAKGNWGIHKRWFSSYEAILDFIHSLTSVFAAAMAGRKRLEGWEMYKTWIQSVWSGKVEEVIRALEIRLAELGEAKEDESETSPRGSCRGAEVPEEQRGPDALRRVSQGGPADHIESHGVDGEDVQPSREGTEKFWSEQGPRRCFNSAPIT